VLGEQEDDFVVDVVVQGGKVRLCGISVAECRKILQIFARNERKCRIFLQNRSAIAAIFELTL